MSSLTIKNNKGTSIYISPNGDIKINGTFNYYGTASEGVSEDVATVVPTNNISSGGIAGSGNTTNDLPGVPLRKKKKSVGDAADVMITSLLKRKMMRKF